jgi:hypothetical protein
MSCSPFFQCQLDYARAQSAAYLPDTCAIYEPPNRTTATRTAEGDIDDTFPTNWTLTATVACLVRLPKFREIIQEAGQPLTVDRPTILVPADTVITSSARVKITASLNSLLVGTVFDVIGAPMDSFGLQRIIEAKLVE